MKQTKLSIKILGLLLVIALLASCTAISEGVSSISAPQNISSIAPTPPSSVFQSILPYKSPIDFDELANEGGTDICAWLTVDGTNIDTPVTLGIDNAYYLTHDAYGEYFAGGTPFIDMINTADFSDPVTLMYGHVMPDDTIFSQLHLYKDRDFFKGNRVVTLYLPNNSYTYEVFAAFPHDTSNLMYEKDYTDPVVFKDLLAYIGQKTKEAPNETNVDMKGVTPSDKLLLLSTCDNVGTSRYLVAARLVNTAI